MNFVVRLRGTGKRDLAKIGCQATATRIICQCKLAANALEENIMELMHCHRKRCFL